MTTVTEFWKMCSKYQFYNQFTFYLKAHSPADMKTFMDFFYFFQKDCIGLKYTWGVNLLGYVHMIVFNVKLHKKNN